MKLKEWYSVCCDPVKIFKEPTHMRINAVVYPQSLTLVDKSEYDKLASALEIATKALKDVKKFWDETQTPKAYFIGDTCGGAIEALEKLQG